MAHESAKHGGRAMFGCGGPNVLARALKAALGQTGSNASNNGRPLAVEKRQYGLRLGCATTCHSGADLQPEADHLVIIKDRRLAPIRPRGLREPLRQATSSLSWQAAPIAAGSPRQHNPCARTHLLKDM